MVRSKTNNIIKDENSAEQVSLNFLEETTGFPKEFIKKELFLGKEQVDLHELRSKMLDYLEQADQEVRSYS